MRRTWLPAAIVFSLVPAAATAQDWRVAFSVNGAMQATTSTFSDDFTYQHAYSANIPGEEARIESEYETPTGALFDGGVAVRLVGNLGVGVAVSLLSATGDLQIDARIPHPFHMARHRAVEGVADGRHAQRGIHVQGVYRIPIKRRVYVALFGGPSHFTVEHRVARTVSITESYPFDEAAFSGADLERLDESGWGFNAGVDAGWMFNRNIGLGALVRYAAATIALTPSGRQSRDIDVGGLHVGLGIRAGF